MPLVNKGNRMTLQYQNKCRFEESDQHQEENTKLWPNTVAREPKDEGKTPVVGKNQKLQLPLHHLGT